MRPHPACSQRDRAGSAGVVPSESMRALIGRDAELAELHAALAGAAAGHGSVALVAGDAGIGKTRLLAEVVGAARAAGAVVLYGRCIGLAGPSLPYYSLLDALRSARDTPAAVELADLLRRAEVAPESGPASQLRLFETVETTLADLATGAVVLLVLEDLHWADPSTI